MRQVSGPSNSGASMHFNEEPFDQRFEIAEELGKCDFIFIFLRLLFRDLEFNSNYYSI